MGARVEHGRLGEVQIALIPQVVVEEHELCSLVTLRGAESPVHVAEVVRIVPCPLAMRPRSHEDPVRQTRVLLLDRLIGGQRPVQILGVEPPSDDHHRRRHVCEVRQYHPRLPPVVVVRVIHHFRPELDAVPEELRFDVLDRPEPQEEVVCVLVRPLELCASSPRRFRSRAAERGIEREGVQQEESAVVMEVVPDEPVRDRGLRRDRLERRVGTRQGRRRVETRIRHAQDSDPAVVVRDVLDQPLDRVPRIAAFVDVLGPLFVRIVWAHIHELALAHVAAADVLEGQYVARVDEVGVHPHGEVEPVLSAGLNVVRGAPQQDRIRLRRVLRDVERGEQTHPVPHRDMDFRLREPFPGPLSAASRGREEVATEVEGELLTPLAERSGDPGEPGVYRPFVLETGRSEPELDATVFDREWVKWNTLCSLLGNIESGRV